MRPIQGSRTYSSASSNKHQRFSNPSQTTAPIRVGIIGLSANSLTSWGAKVHLPYLLSPLGRKNYQITALLNSSLNSAVAAQEHFGLPQSVKTYGDPEALASDPDVDLVISVTSPSTRLPTVGPSLKAGKRVFIEWPLAESLDQALALESQAASPQVWGQSIVGLQGRVSPPVQKLKTFREEGKIGKVLSSDIVAASKFLPLPVGVFPESLAFMTDKTKGANSVTIGYGHFIDSVHAALGEWDAPQTQVQVESPEFTLVDPKTWAPKGKVTSDVPDLISVHGSVTGRDGSPALVWNIIGEKGKLQLISHASPLLGSNAYSGPITIKVQYASSDEVEEVLWKWEEWQQEESLKSRSTVSVYERYAAWVHNGMGDIEQNKEWATLSDGILRTKEISAILSTPAL